MQYVADRIFTIDRQLENGCPVVVGVDDGRVKKYNSDYSTEHFFVITGRLTDQKGLYYRFFEVGTNPEFKESRGVTQMNKLHLDENNFLKGIKRTSDPNRVYVVTQIRKNN